MNRYVRIGAIYRKELLNILRDRRAMLAMIIIPVVMYPALMLGFVRAVESDEAKLRSQTFVVETPTMEEADNLLARVVLAQDADAKDQPTFDIRPGNTPLTLLGDEVQLHVELQVSPRPSPFPERLTVHIAFNEVNARSRTAMEQLTAALNRYRERMTRDSLERLLESRPLMMPSTEPVVDLVLNPVSIETFSTATGQQRGGWALGLIVPVILVLMTITGAIYPAIDLTAGERERGTLEALLATPVPVLHLVTAKFLVVATIGLLAAFVNVLSVGATMHFGGLTKAFANAEAPVQFPASTLPIIVFSMIPFALLSSAILVAVCSFARSYKEAQTYVTPVIILALVPAIAATLPSIQLKGIFLVMPVGNMVLLARELFQQTCTWPQVVIVLLSTTLYAAAAVGVAARLFGQEAVLFADAGSYRTLLLRRLMQPSPAPTVAQAVVLIALLFPAVFFINSLFSNLLLERLISGLIWLAVVQFGGLFLLLPLAVAAFLKIDLVNTFRLRLPPARAWLAALLIGVSSWAVATECFALQTRVIPPSEALAQLDRVLSEGAENASLRTIVLLLALIPAVTEEFLFRGFLLSGLGRASGKWTAVIGAGLIFGAFHFVVDKIPVTALMGMLLGYLCWQSRSLWPGILAHAMHNSALMVLPNMPRAAAWLGLAGIDREPERLLPIHVVIPAAVLLLAGLAILATLRQRRSSTANGFSG
ncbi:MAG TPA: ABC transporter permease subunit/CPBP intramembrane protease [Phycisphaerae bacterium]|nr:ABC transporter permease subunit/CPBP intramembrane protease [Phycisphaerae bacterium]HRR87030.1 ABC transporter permease subunit/CPBP intramembrane protease [Phycisphaerae bacterium]